MFSVAILAVDGPGTIGFEGNLSFNATLGTGHGVKLPGTLTETSFSFLSVAILAVDGPGAIGFEGNLSFNTALGTGHDVHFTLGPTKVPIIES